MEAPAPDALRHFGQYFDCLAPSRVWKEVGRWRTPLGMAQPSSPAVSFALVIVFS